ncbi:hypothetical protein [Adlercreutzia sp. ZJ304]|uniref:hypothetical protein n=1 Tax=Adlercreutzia sp. ZJ304 TaxID=2709791 RepID=UPI001F1519D4|nr:hypothetical protein [Adlercreutzia sp. ZJ304]
MTERIDEDGRTRPMSVQWWDGTTYPIEKVVSVCRRSSKRVGGDGVCYAVVINGRETFLYHEDLRWFVEEKITDGHVC